MKIFKKTTGDRIHIYFCGIKILSWRNWRKFYESLVNVHTHNYDIMRYCAPEKLDLLLSDMFYRRTGKMATETLTTLNEKLLWLAMFERTPLKEQCADKVRVRDYVAKTIGAEYLPELYDVLSRGEDFQPDKYPKQFVLSYNAGSGQNIIVTDKNKLDIAQTRKTINSWMFHNQSYGRGEMQYYNIPPRVIVREMLDIIPDTEYKLWCFNGKVGFICLTPFEHGRNDVGRVLYDTNWNRLPFYQHYNDGRFIKKDFPKPAFLDELIKASEKLAKPFKFARIDFYELINGDIKFGEITFTPANGKVFFVPDNDKWQNHFGDMIEI